MVSASAAFPSTFVLREVRQLRALGLKIVICQLRPLFGKMNLTGFEELSPLVVRPRWLSFATFKSIVYFMVRRPRLFLSYIGIVSRGVEEPKNLLKMSYVLLASMSLAYQLRGRSIRHVRAHFLHTEALAARLLSGFWEVPYSLTAHTVVNHFPRSIIEEIIKQASFMVADTHQVRCFLHSLGASVQCIYLIRNGVSIEEFPLRIHESASGPPIILAAGYLSPKKGFHNLLSACALLRERGVRFRCVLIGDGGERERLITLKRALGLDKQVEMLGNLSFVELRDWYYRSTAFVMPSLVAPDKSSDGLPTVVIEALASGLPVVGTDTAGIPDAVLDGVTGFLVPPNDPESIADRLQMLLSQPDLRVRLARDGRQLIEREFDLRQNAKALADLILLQQTPALVPQVCEPPREAIHT